MIGRNLINNRWLALACIVFVLFMLLACGGAGGGGPANVGEPVEAICDATSVPENGECRTFAMLLNLRIPTPFVEDGQPVSLEVVLYKPFGDGRFPTLVFHHGSTGSGSDPSTFGLTFTHKSLASFFVDRGYMVAFPQRRGRGKSDGLYDEGFKTDRSGYSCNRDLSLAGAERALEDLDVITDWIRNRTDVDTTQLLVGGTSRGGILSVAHVARRPDVYLGAINFVGGWIAEGCGDYLAINRSLFLDAARFPGQSLWLYGANDSFYSLAYSRTNFDAFSMAGGMGTMVELTRQPGLNGHFIINDPELWGPAVDDYLAWVG
ncbi:MAG: CocE/NonD family hydrolase [Woeseiaceae bacterium]|nr:CocE/NonD family hydrolase [Woeseiaceae bacterium]